MEYEVSEFLGQEFIRATNSDGDILLIPMDDGNADYQQYLLNLGAE